MNEKSAKPFRLLGGRLKTLREAHKESLDEVSVAVEIDLDKLEKFESGETRPSEEILLLILSHFKLSDEEATKIWTLAGYDDPRSNDDREPESNNKQMTVVMPMDIRIVYTDLAHVTANNYGVVMNFMQSGGLGNQPLAVARVGMSREHAESVIKLLQDTLRNTETIGQPPKKLSAPQPEPTDLED